MIALVQTAYEGLSSLQLEETPLAKASPLSVTVKTAYTPILPWDWRLANGELASMQARRPPMIISYGFTGTVTKVGALCSASLQDQPVLGINPSGAAQTINVVPPLPYLFKLPAEVSLAAAATLIGGADAALSLIKAAHVQTGQVVIVTGATGGVGTALIQLLKEQGAIVIGLTAPQNKAWLHQLGSNYELDYTQPLAPQLAQLPKPALLLDAVGQPELLTQLSTNQPELVIWPLSLQQWQPPLASQTFQFTNRPLLSADYRHLLDLLATQQLQPIIRATYDFHDFQTAFKTAQTHGQHGRVLLSYDSSLN